MAYTAVLGAATSTDGGYSGLNPADVSVTNKDDESIPALSIGDVVVAEGNSGTTPAIFTVSLAPASTRTVTVQYATADDTATAPGLTAPRPGRCPSDRGDEQEHRGLHRRGHGGRAWRGVHRRAVQPDERYHRAGQARGTIGDDDAPPAQPCSPRPPPLIESRQIGAGRLQVTVTAQETPALPSNNLQRLDFGTADDARIEIPVRRRVRRAGRPRVDLPVPLATSR